MVEATVTDTNGNPVPSARIKVWEANEDGMYDVQYDGGQLGGRAHMFSDSDGGYRFWGITPPRIRSHMMDSWGTCSLRWAAHHSEQPTCTSW